MAAPRFSTALAGEYQRLFDTCTLRPKRQGEVDALLQRIARDMPRYQAVAATLGVPWAMVALIHHMEANGDFSRHLHNGDPLTARTVQVPAGRPPQGTPPFAWEASAADALRLEGFERWKEWGLAGMLYKLEAYNGWGYRLRHPEVLTPYLWSGSNHYESGKFVADGRWSDTAVSKQIGAAVLLRRMAESGQYNPAPTLLAPAGEPQAETPPPLRYAPDTVLPHAAALQAFLNTLPGVYLKPDGKLGPRSSEAFKLATGRYLAGDAREQQQPQPRSDTG